MTLAGDAIEALAARGLTLATCEASVGGLIGHLLTDVPGASRAFVGGIAPYANLVKVDVLGLPEAMFTEHGAVSEPAVLAMARATREVLRADIGLAETGVASPTGNPGRPAGLYFVALAAEGFERVVQHAFAGTRAENKAQAADAALRLVLDYLLDYREQTR